MKDHRGVDLPRLRHREAEAPSAEAENAARADGADACWRLVRLPVVRGTTGEEVASTRARRDRAGDPA
ncbi:hypothetical protein OIE67_23610 [Nonomuraea fuscirosea]|uniref:hypothetical protein n=1 Tax=Nonomuraea fuscirosea TaxID=1291556 RepID=UPI002DD9709C|nr:hypothetical protein [Nonomuraea fuscirosea]WSA57493.1 hypothetical protein OIE67_23610 [Nonomuraea fuscirosea]